ncbi:MAG TPA: glycosyltransferase, partial [Candidatus Hydrogenedentes bacterium]|nr:glycosyltransferase [Candidatus Hydrogenedentota bacterium]
MSTAMNTTSIASARDRASAASNVRLILGSGFQPDYVREIANAYSRAGRSVEVIGGDMHAGTAFEPNVRFLNLRGRDSKEPSKLGELRKLAKYYARLIRHLSASPASAIYDVSIGRPFLRCLLMYPLIRLLGKKIIYTAHNVLPHDRATTLNRAVYFLIYRALVDVIIVHGQALKTQLVEQFSVSADRVHVVSHGTYNPVTNPAVTKRAARELLGINPEMAVALVFGFQRPYKGTHFVLESLEHSSVSPSLTLLIRGQATDSAYRLTLEETIARVEGKVNVNARFESVPDGDVETLFKAADVVLLPYLEGSQSGIKYMAYAFGRPVLASRIGSLGEFLEPGV